jgi:hexulose-6-phosphate isomerase
MNTSFTRRDFLKAGGTALAAAALPWPALGAEKRPIKKGMMWAAVAWDSDHLNSPVLEKFKMIRTTGFEGIEIDGSMDQTEVLKARDETGLILPSVICATHWKKPLSDPDPALREAGLEGLKIALRDAKAYGSSSVLLVPAIVNKNVSYNEAYRRSQEEIKKAIPLAEELGVKIAIENVWNNFLLSPLEAARYIDEFQSPAMAWHFDVGNCINNGWPEQWIHILGKRIHKLHIKEYSRKKRDAEGLWKGFDVEYLQGDDNWPAVMAALDDVGYHGWGTAEPTYWPKGVASPVRLQQVSQKLDQIFSL